MSSEQYCCLLAELLALLISSLPPSDHYLLLCVYEVTRDWSFSPRKRNQMLLLELVLNDSLILKVIHLSQYVV